MKLTYLPWVGVPLFVSVIGAQQVVSHVNIDASTTAWRIDQPVVNQPDTVYPEIRFQPNDSVQVKAGGCVQTGGHGKNWKLYVNPDQAQGGDHNRLYRGLITIPHSTLAPNSSIASAITATSIIVLGTASDVDTNDLFLHLGYKDKDGAYGDNGYSSHDDGTGDQCKDVGNAWVVITITHTNYLSLALAEIEVPENNSIGVLPWAFDVFANGSQVFTIPSARYYIDVASYRPSHGSVPPHAQIPIQAATNTRIKIVGYTGDRAVGEANLRWDVNRKDPPGLVVHVPLKGNDPNSGIAFHFAASNAENNQIQLIFDTAELSGNFNLKAQYLFMVTLNGRVVLELLPSDLNKLTGGKTIGFATVDGSLSDLKITVTGYERGIAGGSSVPLKTGEYFIRVGAYPASAEFVVGLAVDKE